MGFDTKRQNSPATEGAGCSSDQGEAAGERSFTLGLVGRGIQKSSSPALHEAEGAANGMRLVYRLYDFDQMVRQDSELAGFLECARTLRLDGLNVTYPFKQLVMPLLDRVDDGAAMVGAVNTIVFRNGVATGYNTDLYGFTENFRESLGSEPRDTVVLLGAGGAGAAAAVSMAGLGCRDLRIVDTDKERAKKLVQAISARFEGVGCASYARLEEAMVGADGLINATPIGMLHHPGSPVSSDLLSPHLWVADIVYVPRDTELLGIARRLGCKTVDGGGMAVYQAAAAFDLFTGCKADRSRMLKCFLASLS